MRPRQDQRESVFEGLPVNVSGHVNFRRQPWLRRDRDNKLRLGCVRIRFQQPSNLGVSGLLSRQKLQNDGF